MPSYTIDSKASKLVVTARSSVHDTDCLWTGITGSIDADLGQLEGTQAEVSVDMTTADAGDWLKNRKMRKDMDFERHPKATIQIDSLSNVQADGDKVSATLEGTLSWRGKSISVSVRGEGKLDDNELRAEGKFDLDITQLGIKPPKILMIKIGDIVNCTALIVARAT